MDTTAWTFADKKHPDSPTSFHPRDYIKVEGKLDLARVHVFTFDETPTTTFDRIEVSIYPIPLEAMQAASTYNRWALLDNKDRLLIGKWAAATMGDTSGAKIAMLDINKDNISVDVQRDTGFLVGFGIEVPDLTVMGSETDPRVIGHESSDANPEGGLRAMETLLAKDPDINVIYTINEPAAEGAFQAMKNAGKEAQSIIVSVDGGCPGVASVKSGVIGATSQQYPLKMAGLGIDAIAAYAKDGTKPTVTEGLSFFNTGVNLVTDKPAEGVPSIDTTEGTALCWG